MKNSRNAAAPAPSVCEQAVMLEIPVGADLPANSISDVGESVLNLRLDAKAAGHLMLMYRSLNAKSMRLKNGRHVDSANDAVRWVLEQFGQGLEELNAAR